jgi:hypothetical protein
MFEPSRIDTLASASGPATHKNRRAFRQKYNPKFFRRNREVGESGKTLQTYTTARASSAQVRQQWCSYAHLLAVVYYRTPLFEALRTARCGAVMEYKTPLEAFREIGTGESRLSSPTTPPYMRVRIWRFSSVELESVHQPGKTERVKVSNGKGHRQGWALRQTPRTMGDRLPCTTAGFTTRVLGGTGLRCPMPVRPTP